MAEAGSIADKVKTQADIVRVIGEYVRLKKSGQNFTGLCPFHSEKTPSFAVHPVKQIYHCFGCGVGGDVFSFVMAVERCDFPEAIRIVAEKCGIPLPRPKERSPEERKATQQRTAFVEMHREAAVFFVQQLNETPEGRAARGYLEDRGLDNETIARFGLGYAPSSGDALLKHLRQKYAEKLLDQSGLFSRGDASGGGRPYDRFRRRIMFPIADERGRVIAFGGRALGDDLPKYLNSPETPIYTKSNVLYNLHNAKEAIRIAKFAVLVEGYMDAIAVARAGVANVVASCGTSLTEPQVKLLARPMEAPRVVVNYDPDSAGQAATERSLALLLEQQFDARVLALPGAADPDKFIREKGAEAYQKLLAQAPAFLDYLITRARAQFDLTTAEGKLRAVNFLMPYVQRMPNRLMRSEWATRIASQLRIEEPVLRESLRKAASERRSEVKPKPELMASPVRPVERRLVQMLFEAEGFRQRLAQEIQEYDLHKGLETEKILAALLPACVAGERPDPNALAAALSDRDKGLLFSFAFESGAPPTWEEAESCLTVLRKRHVEADLAQFQREVEAKPAAAERRRLLARKSLEAALESIRKELEAKPSAEETRRLIALEQELRKQLAALTS